MNSQKYLVVTTMGAYVFATTNSLGTDEEKILRWLLSLPESPPVSKQIVLSMEADLGVEDIMPILQHLLGKKLLAQERQPHRRSTEPMQDALPRLLHSLSETGKAMISGTDGLCIASIGFDIDRSHALSAMASKLVDSLYHANCDVFELLDMQYGLLCLYDMAARSLFTFFPLEFGPNRLVVVTQGKALFSGNTFRDFVWVLWGRYGTDS